MFWKKKKEKITNQEDNVFGSKNYKMKDVYDANLLIVARFEQISCEIHDTEEGYGPMCEKTEMKYIFEPIVEENNNITYREIFTGFVAKTEEEYFGLPYIIEPEPFTDYYPELKDTLLPKLRLIWILNEINYSKKSSKIKCKATMAVETKK